MHRAIVTLSYDEKRYTVAEDADTVLKGNLACDCKASWLIRAYCDPEFPALRCGHAIAIVSLEESQMAVRGAGA